MKARIWTLAVIVTFWAAGSVAADQTLTGVVSDSMCGTKHGMANMSDRECTQMCAAQGAQYVLVAGGKIYKLTNRASELKTHAGHTVNLTGEMKKDTIAVSKVEMPKPG